MSGKLSAQLQRLPQRQDSLSSQLDDLYDVANKLGLYDAADFIAAAARQKKATLKRIRVSK